MSSNVTLSTTKADPPLSNLTLPLLRSSLLTPPSCSLLLLTPLTCLLASSLTLLMTFAARLVLSPVVMIFRCLLTAARLHLLLLGCDGCLLQLIVLRVLLMLLLFLLFLLVACLLPLALPPRLPRHRLTSCILHLLTASLLCLLT